MTAAFNAVKVRKMTKCVRYTIQSRDLIIGSGEVLISVTFDDGMEPYQLSSLCSCLSADVVLRSGGVEECTARTSK